jgi:trimeric autotransporter adhesin
MQRQERNSTVAYSVSSITATPTVADTDATATLNGTPISSGSVSGAISLRPDANLITMIVTAEDGAHTTTTIIVARPAKVWLPITVR